MTHYSGKDLGRSFRTVRKNTIEIAKDLPGDKYGFQVTSDTRSIAETLAHIAASPRWQHRLHGIDRKTFVSFDDFGGYVREAGTFETTLKTKEDILKALETEGEAFAAWLETLSDEVLAEQVAFTPPLDNKTRFEMLLGVKEHEMHHRAQLMLVERILGIVPHLTRQRESRNQAR